MKISLIALLPLVLIAPLAHAKLTFTALDQTLTPFSSEPTATAIFPLKNTGAGPIRIHTVRIDCPCVVARWPTQILQPNEEAQITVQADLTNKVGATTYSLQVLTDDPQNPSYVLTLQLALRDAVQLNPRFVYWKIGDELTTKTAELILHPETKLQWQSWQAQDPTFNVTEISDPATPQLRRLQITPPGPPRQRATCPILIHLRHPDGTTYTTTLIARVL